jgi:hypothetical protein
LKNNPQSRKENLVVQEFENEILIYDLNINKVYCLNETSSLVWQLCDGTNSVSEISRSLSQKLKPDVSEDLVWLAIEQFKRDRLLDENNPVEIDFGGLSRREVIKKIGLASMVALPVISSVVAPSAASGQSLFPFLAACTTDSQCASGNCSDVNPVFPQLCCVTGVSIARPPGTAHTCTHDQGVCNVFALSNCCSGMSTLRTDLPVCAPPTAPSPNYPCVCS